MSGGCLTEVSFVITLFLCICLTYVVNRLPLIVHIGWCYIKCGTDRRI